MKAFKVIDPGAQTTVQDPGRSRYLQFGIPVCGTLDKFSAEIANYLVGNNKQAAVLEMTFMGPKLEVFSQMEVAVTGAEMPIKVNGNEMPAWQTLTLSPGDILQILPVKTGFRGYLAITGGFDVPKIMGSRSTYVGGNFGGLEGRPLKSGDILGRLESSFLGQIRQLPVEDQPTFLTSVPLRAVPGPQDDFFDQGLDVLFNSPFTVSNKADRMGCRLEGSAVELKPDVPQSIISEPILPGAIQVPPDFQPIIVLVEMTVGGYAKPATVIGPDLSLVAQIKSGDTVNFQKISLTEAHRICKDTKDKMARIKSQLTV
ncbi:MAG: biotin-dependent carboxyltransferase [Desulfobacula sp.]|nr:biotin-dependent carboxyltransferase [Desulfobacula sp.]